MGHDLYTALVETDGVFNQRLQWHAPEFDELLTSGTERHGVWEWRVMRQDPPLRRYIVFVVTNLDSGSLLRDAELHVGIDDDRSFTKRVVARGMIGQDVDLNEWLTLHLPTAVDMANALTEDDLDTLYVQRRLFPPDQTSATADV